jgi:hypothetical protein
MKKMKNKHTKNFETFAEFANVNEELRNIHRIFERSMQSDLQTLKNSNQKKC